MNLSTQKQAIRKFLLAAREALPRAVRQAVGLAIISSVTAGMPP